MLTILSPAKTQDFSGSHIASKLKIIEAEKLESIPKLLDNTYELLEILQKLSTCEIMKLMDVSSKLAELNHSRFQKFTKDFTSDNAQPAIYVFKGDVYTSLEFDKYQADNFSFLGKNFRIISGFYGILKPFDLIKEYRLEMKTQLANHKGSNLYKFWDNIITSYLNEDIEKDHHKFIINLASNEYFKAVNPKLLAAPIINIEFKEYKNGDLKIIALNAKRARSMMSNFIIKNKIESPQDLQAWNEKGYSFKKDLSSENNFLFAR